MYNTYRCRHVNRYIPSAATTGIREGISPYEAPESNALAAEGLPVSIFSLLPSFITDRQHVCFQRRYRKKITYLASGGGGSHQDIGFEDGLESAGVEGFTIG